MVQNTHSPAGIGVIPNLDRLARKMTDEGNEMIIETLFSLPGQPLCLINCYLPSGMATEAKEKFPADIDALLEICAKYSGSHIIIIGDLNQDHYHRDSVKEQRTCSFLTEQSQGSGSEKPSLHLYQSLPCPQIFS